MEMSRIATARPISSRPLTSAHSSVINTGLIAPKSSRGRTALRRQVQDKSYFVSLLRSKINEILSEINVLSRESEIIAKEEARMEVYRQKAETLAKELNELSLDLITYNKFLDRIRLGEDEAAIRNDINEIKPENQALIVNLENDYSKLLELQSTVKKNDEKLKEFQRVINSIESQFDESQRVEFNMIQSMNNQLNKEIRMLENELGIWRSKKSEIEEKTIKDNNLIKMELLQAIIRLRHLEKQKNELLNANVSDENERGRLLAKVKQDNNYITTLENKIEQLNEVLTEIKKEIDFYKNGDKLLTMAEIREQEKILEEFFHQYTEEKEKLLNNLESVNHEISDTTSKLSRSLNYLNSLKQIREESQMNYDITNELIIQKRKSELELYQHQQSRKKAETEKESLTVKIQKLNENIETYSNIDELKSKIESKLDDTKQGVMKLEQEIAKIKLENENMQSKIRAIQIESEKDTNYQKIVELENKLNSISKINQRFKENDSSEMLNAIKVIVLENVKKYNQSLLGF